MVDEQQKIGFKNISYYFIPLAAQAASQSLTYPLVAIVASSAAGGSLNIAGLVQGTMVMNITGMLGCGLITTGMVFGKSKEGFQNFRKLSINLGFIVSLIQLFLAIPIISHFVLGKLLKLPPSIEASAYQVIWVGIPLQFLFFLRNPYTAILYNNKETTKASLPSFARIIFTALLAKIFVSIDLVGIRWAVVCMTIPVAIETYLYWYFATPLLKHLKPTSTRAANKKEMFFFNIPISVSSMLIFLTSFLMSAYIARAPNPEQMLPVYVLCLGLVNPMSFAATKIQPIVILFLEETKGQYILPKFAVFAGLILGVIPLLFTLPFLANFYYVNIQSLPKEHLPLITETACILFFVPFAVALRAYSEGLAAYHKKTTVFMTGQAMYLGTAAFVGFFALGLGLPGNMIGGLGLISANLASSATMRLTLFWDKHKLPSDEPLKGGSGPAELT